MTLDDIITFLREETEQQTLTEKDMTRCVLLAFDLGMDAGKRSMREEKIPAVEGALMPSWRRHLLGSRLVAYAIIGVLFVWYLAEAVLCPEAVRDFDGPRG